MRRFYRFSKVLEESVEGHEEEHELILDLKNLELLKNRWARVNNWKFTKDNSIPAILLRSKVQQCVEKYWKPLFALI